jgi:hypothetical protein
MKPLYPMRKVIKIEQAPSKKYPHLTMPTATWWTLDCGHSFEAGNMRNRDKVRCGFCPPKKKPVKTWLVKYRYDGPIFETIRIEAENVVAVYENTGSSLHGRVVITADHVTFRIHTDVNAALTVEKE